MTLEGVLFVLVALGLLANWPVAVFLSIQALKRPRILALTLFAWLWFIVTLGVTAYVLAVINAQLGYPVPREIAQQAFRLVLLALVASPWLFWRAYFTDSFRDRS